MDRLGSNFTTAFGVVANTKTYNLHTSAAETTNGNTAINAGDCKEALLAINISAVSGTTPSCQFVLEVNDGLGNWYSIPNATIAAQTTTGSVIIALTNFHDNIRLSWSLTGTTPSFTFAATLLGKA